MYINSEILLTLFSLDFLHVVKGEAKVSLPRLKLEKYDNCRNEQKVCKYVIVSGDVSTRINVI